MRPLFATRRQRLLARVGLYGGAVLVGLPLATSQMLVGTIRQATLTSLGGREREDVRAALAALCARGLGRRGFVLLGVSMGAVAVLRAAAEEPDVRAVVAEAPYDDYRSMMAHHARLYYGLPHWFPLVPAAIAVAEWRAGFDADEVSAVEAARRVRGALLLIVDGGDPGCPRPSCAACSTPTPAPGACGRPRARPTRAPPTPRATGRRCSASSRRTASESKPLERASGCSC